MITCWWHVPEGTRRRDDSFWRGRGRAKTGSNSAFVGFANTLFWMDDLITSNLKVNSIAKTTSFLRSASEQRLCVNASAIREPGPKALVSGS